MVSNVYFPSILLSDMSESLKQYFKEITVTVQSLYKGLKITIKHLVRAERASQW
jgi:hypothetical protein